MHIDSAVAPGVAVVFTEGGDEHLDGDALSTALFALAPGTDVVVVVGATRPTSLEDMTSAVRRGGVAVRGEPSIDAVKRTHDGLVASTLDRDRIVRPRLPLAASPAGLVDALGDAVAHPPPEVRPAGRVRVADLVARFDPGDIVFVDTGRRKRPPG